MDRKIVGKIFPEAIKNIDNGKCPTCGGPIGEFKDELSRKEFKISGMCQKCQDKIFGKYPPIYESRDKSY
jgi:RNA polymerase-binding transcription factor DksA